MQDYIDQAKNKFDELDSREKILLIGGSIAALLLFFIFLVLVPSYEKAHTLREDIRFNQEDINWMQDAAAKLKSSGGTSFSGINRSLLALLDEQFKTAGLSSNIKSIQPEGKSKAKVRLVNCNFDQLIALIAKLESNNNVLVSRSSLKQAASSGRVDGNITFSRG